MQPLNRIGVFAQVAQLRAVQRFAVPVALPPAGWYPVSVERAWERHRARDRRRPSAVARVGEGGSLAVARDAGLPPGDRLRVVFRPDHEAEPR